MPNIQAGAARRAHVDVHAPLMVVAAVTRSTRSNTDCAIDSDMRSPFNAHAGELSLQWDLLGASS